MIITLLVFGLTTQAEPRRASHVNRESGTEGADRRWLQRIVRQRAHKLQMSPIRGRHVPRPVKPLRSELCPQITQTTQKKICVVLCDLRAKILAHKTNRALAA